MPIYFCDFHHHFLNVELYRDTRAYIFDLAFTNLIFRESNTFTEKVTKELISRNIFQVRENFELNKSPKLISRKI